MARAALRAECLAVAFRAALRLV
eukprot:COSAG04_NODE_32168_length_252_cov_1.313725_2_plen_22_part_01